LVFASRLSYGSISHGISWIGRTQGSGHLCLRLGSGAQANKRRAGITPPRQTTNSAAVGAIGNNGGDARPQAQLAPQPDAACMHRKDAHLEVVLARRLITVAADKHDVPVVPSHVRGLECLEHVGQLGGEGAAGRAPAAAQRRSCAISSRLKLCTLQTGLPAAARLPMLVR
jgi:hypothetical protein